MLNRLLDPALRRTVLVGSSCLGLAASVLAGSALFASLEDTATTGTQDVHSLTTPPTQPPPPANVDIRIASTRYEPGYYCSEHSSLDDYSHELTTPLETVTLDLTTSRQQASTSICIRNFGTVDAEVYVATIDVVDIDDDCTDQEGQFDHTCGENQVGELSSVVRYGWQHDGRPEARRYAMSTEVPRNDTVYVQAGREALVVLSLQVREDVSTVAAQSDSMSFRYQFRALPLSA